MLLIEIAGALRIRVSDRLIGNIPFMYAVRLAVGVRNRILLKIGEYGSKIFIVCIMGLKPSPLGETFR